MPITDKFFAINIRKYLALGDDHEAGEPGAYSIALRIFLSKESGCRTFFEKKMQ